MPTCVRALAVVVLALVMAATSLPAAQAETWRLQHSDCQASLDGTGTHYCVRTWLNDLGGWKATIEVSPAAGHSARVLSVAKRRPYESTPVPLAEVCGAESCPDVTTPTTYTLQCSQCLPSVVEVQTASDLADPDRRLVAGATFWDTVAGRSASVKQGVARVRYGIRLRGDFMQSRTVGRLEPRDGYAMRPYRIKTTIAVPSGSTTYKIAGNSFFDDVPAQTSDWVGTGNAFGRPTLIDHATVRFWFYAGGDLQSVYVSSPL